MFIKLYDALWCHLATLTARQGVKVKYVVITNQHFNYAISSYVSIDRPLFAISRHLDMCHEIYTHDCIYGKAMDFALMDFDL